MAKTTTEESKEAAVATLTYEQSFEELRVMVSAIEGGQISLDESIRRFKRGSALLERCRAILETAEMEVRELTADELKKSARASG
ncbi:MAG: exodeoxyribonuclease VII small subunit [Planctomycetota bacterium]|nr:exodeoxyribonuclease VII small subunit [Planctomycetota bacterium]